MVNIPLKQSRTASTAIYQNGLYRQLDNAIEEIQVSEEAWVEMVISGILDKNLEKLNRTQELIASNEELDERTRLLAVTNIKAVNEELNLDLELNDDVMVAQEGILDAIGSVFKAIFEGIMRLIKFIINLIKKFIEWVGSLFGGKGSSGGSGGGTSASTVSKKIDEVIKKIDTEKPEELDLTKSEVYVEVMKQKLNTENIKRYLFLKNLFDINYTFKKDGTIDELNSKIENLVIEISNLIKNIENNGKNEKAFIKNAREQLDKNKLELIKLLNNTDKIKIDDVIELIKTNDAKFKSNLEKEITQLKLKDTFGELLDIFDLKEEKLKKNVGKGDTVFKLDTNKIKVSENKINGNLSIKIDSLLFYDKEINLTKNSNSKSVSVNELKIAQIDNEEMNEEIYYDKEIETMATSIFKSIQGITEPKELKSNLEEAKRDLATYTKLEKKLSLSTDNLNIWSKNLENLEKEVDKLFKDYDESLDRNELFKSQIGKIGKQNLLDLVIKNFTVFFKFNLLSKLYLINNLKIVYDYIKKSIEYDIKLHDVFVAYWDQVVKKSPAGNTKTEETEEETGEGNTNNE